MEYNLFYDKVWFLYYIHFLFRVWNSDSQEVIAIINFIKICEKCAWPHTIFPKVEDIVFELLINGEDWLLEFSGSFFTYLWHLTGVMMVVSKIICLIKFLDTSYKWYNVETAKVYLIECGYVNVLWNRSLEYS